MDITLAQQPPVTGKLDSAPELSIIVPTFCERGNVDALIEEVAGALPDVRWEILFVDDDSNDGTAEHVRSLSDPKVRCLQRIGRRGLSSACIEGMLAVSAPIVAVMDADLQHDTSKLRDMVDEIRNGADLAVGTRVAPGGSYGAMSRGRLYVSQFSNKIAKRLLSVNLSDPMSGFFMMRRSLFMIVVHELSGLGFKILLDIVASMPRKSVVVEVPYQFRSRLDGESKMDRRAALDFVLLIIDKTAGRFLPTRFIAFCVVGSVGAILHFLVLGTLFKGAGLSFSISQGMAAGTATVFNFLLNNILTFRDYRLKGSKLIWGLLSYAVIASIGVMGNVGTASFLFSNLGSPWTLSALAGVLVGTVWNYTVTKALTWKAG